MSVPNHGVSCEFVVVLGSAKITHAFLDAVSSTPVKDASLLYIATCCLADVGLLPKGFCFGRFSSGDVPYVGAKNGNGLIGLDSLSAPVCCSV